MTAKQNRFCEYIIDLNATQAAIRAGYHSEHISPVLRMTQGGAFLI